MGDAVDSSIKPVTTVATMTTMSFIQPEAVSFKVNKPEGDIEQGSSNVDTTFSTVGLNTKATTVAQTLNSDEKQ